MGWFKVDDQLSFHAKVVLAGNSAMGLWVRAGAWSSAHLTDGFIPEHMAIAMANPMAKMAKLEDAPQLVQAGLWGEVEGGYQFHDWELFQPDSQAQKEKRKSVSQSRSEAGRKGAEARWGGSQPDNNHGKQDGKQDGKPMAPTRPDLKSFSEDDEKPAKKTPETPFPEGFEIKDAHRSKAAEHGIDVNWQRVKFEDHHRSKDSRFRDWSRAFHTWLNNAIEYQDKDSPARPRHPDAPDNRTVFEMTPEEFDERERIHRERIQARRDAMATDRS